VGRPGGCGRSVPPDVISRCEATKAAHIPLRRPLDTPAGGRAPVRNLSWRCRSSSVRLLVPVLPLLAVAAGPSPTAHAGGPRRATVPVGTYGFHTRTGSNRVSGTTPLDGVSDKYKQQVLSLGQTGSPSNVAVISQPWGRHG
jgi:hypothetical protein